MVTDQDAVMRFRREAHAAAKLSHPNIIQLYDTGVDGDVYYIVMEYLPEPDLKRIIREYAPLPLRKVLEVSIQCARALAYAHRQGLVHRDVKPHNILFTDDGRVKLSDFGIVAAAGEHGLTADGLVLGSAYYISPEQAQGGPATAQSDIYSLGVVMFECITGRVPFAGATAAEIAAKHVRERPPTLRSLNPSITPSAEFVINKAMAREAARRYRSTDEMLVDLEKLADGIELDRTGVLGIPTEEATLPLAPAQAPVLMEPPGLLRPAAPTVEPRQPVFGPASRPPAKAPGATAAVTVAAVIVALVALGAIVWLLKSFLVPSPSARKVNVPAVKGMALAQARAEITKAGLRPGDVSYVEADTAPNGTVIEQVPGMGEMVEPGAAVNLTLSRGKQTVTVPAVSQRSVAEATERLQAANLHLGEMERIFHESIPAGLVVKQAIAPGTKVEAGTSIDLTVSKGPEQPPATVATGPVTTPGTDPTTANDPEVEVREDETFRSDNPAERQLLVKVSAMGTQMGQRIQIIKSDDNPVRAVITVNMDPGASKEFPVKVVGNGTLEVRLDGRRVFSAPCPISAPQ
jgi:serine/threonine-protein kinase